jgi:PleD family two-component response regulator
VAAYRPGDTWDGLLTRAADALQRAKRTGRNRCEVA